MGRAGGGVAAVVAGLGNITLPGTRHSVGIDFLDWYAREVGVGWRRERELDAHVAEVLRGGRRCVLVKPTTPMNNNGVTMAAVLRRLGTPVSNLYVVHDDLETSVGKVGYSCGGGTRGHNGVRSLILHLHSSAFHRFRIGIHRPPSRVDVPVYVLQPFPADERPAMLAAFASIAEHLEQKIFSSPSSPAS